MTPFPHQGGAWPLDSPQIQGQAGTDRMLTLSPVAARACGWHSPPPQVGPSHHRLMGIPKFLPTT